MLMLLSGATRYPRSETVGDLIVPRAWASPDSLTLAPGRWAMDNGCFGGLDRAAFLRMLETFDRRPGCLFVTVPDVVGDAASTLRQWPFWSRLLVGLGWPVAFVAQDGITADRVPWWDLDALFIGGTTHFKESADVRSLCGIAKAYGKWVHWGRVNSRRRYALALKAGADSFDGSGFSMFPDTWVPVADKWHAQIHAQPELPIPDGGSDTTHGANVPDASAS